MTDPAPQTVLRGNLNDSINAVLFGGNGELVTGTGSGAVNIWNLDRKRIVSTKQPHQSSILSLSSIKGGHQFTSFSRDGNLKLWDFETYNSSTEAMVTLNTGTMHFCNSCTDNSETLNDPNMVSTPSGREADVLLWDLRTVSQPCQIFTIPSSLGLTSHLHLLYGSQEHNSIEEGFHMSRSLLYVGSEDGSLTMFDIRSSKILITRQIHQQPIFAIQLLNSKSSLNSNQTIITGAADTKLNFFKCTLSTIHTKDKCIVNTEIQQSIVESNDSIADNSSTFIDTDHNAVNTESFVDLNRIRSVELPSSTGTGSICIRSDKRIMASGHWDGSVRLFECKRNFKPLAVLRHHRESVYSIDFNTNNTSKYYGMFASGSKDGTIALWDLYKDTIK